MISNTVYSVLNVDRIFHTPEPAENEIHSLLILLHSKPMKYNYVLRELKSVGPELHTQKQIRTLNGKFIPAVDTIPNQHKHKSVRQIKFQGVLRKTTKL